MDFNAAKINSTTGTRQVNAQKVLKEGSLVPVKVVRSFGGGKYEGFVAGVKVNFSSERTLKAGDVFTAMVNGRDGKIFLIPQNAGDSLLNTLNFEMNELNFQNNPSASILQMFTQAGLKIDSLMMSRIKGLAVRFGNKQKAAAEILVMLAEKGITATEQEINELLLQLEGELSWSEGEKLINKINSKQGAWYILPFELIQYEDGKLFSEDSKDILGSGNLRLLFDSGKMLKLINLDCLYRRNRYLFSLVFEGGKCKEVRFNTGNSEEKEKTSETELKKRFIAADMAGVEIKRAQITEIEGNASSSESLYTFGGEV